MKKILNLVTIIFFIVTAYLAIDFYSKQELSSLLVRSEYYAEISTEQQNSVLTTLIDTANKYHVNVQKTVYRLQDDGNFIIDIFAHINNKEAFYKNLTMKSGSILDANSPDMAYLSSVSTEDENLIGMISLLDRTNTINIKKMSDAGKENLNGIYYFTGVNSKSQFKEILVTLQEHGIHLENNQVSVQSSVSLDQNVLSFIPLIFLLVIITIVYNYIMSYKEFSVMMLHGFSYKDIIRKKTIQYFIMNSIIASITAVAIIMLHIVLYGVLNHQLYLKVVLLAVSIDLILTIVESLCGYIISFIDITICLRNKKPQKQINMLNLLAKVCFSFLIIFLITNSAVKIQEFTSQHYNMSTWKESIHYAYTMVTNYSRTENSNTYEVGSKCQKLYSLLEKKGAILMRINEYYRATEGEKQLMNETQAAYESETIEVNYNFMLQHPIYDLNGEKITPNASDEDVLTVYIPEKYLSVKDKLEEDYIFGYQLLRYFDENLYYKTSTKKQVDKQQEVKFQYIQNGQKIFSYDPDVNPDLDNYIIDPILILTNANNRGTDVYFSIMTGGSLLINIQNSTNPYDEVFPFIQEAGLEENITATPTVYSKVDQKQYDLNLMLSKYIFMLVISFIGYTIMTIFITLNYIESNKEMNVIKKLFGYSYHKRNFKFYMLSILPITVITPIFMFAFKIFTFNIITLFFMIMFDFLTIAITLMIFDRQSINDVLKGS